MKKTLLKGAGYLAAPKLTFAASNPKKAAFLKAAGWVTNRVLPRRKGPSKGEMALKGLGAAAVAIPVGLWLGRRVMGSPQSEGAR